MGFTTERHHETILKLEQGGTIEQALDVFLSNVNNSLLLRTNSVNFRNPHHEDVMETLLGKEIVDELDEVEDMRKLARDQAAQTEEE